MIGFAFRQLVIWIGVLVLVVILIANRPQMQPNSSTPSTGSADAAGAAARASPPNSLVFRANPQGHVVLDGNVNGAQVRFLVDTGATMVGLTMHDAASAGLSRGDLNFSLRTSTANGIARAAPVRLRELRIGQLSLTDVDAAVVENL